MSLIDELKDAEGYRENPYRDVNGLWTGGYGHLMMDKDWSNLKNIGDFKSKLEYWEHLLEVDISNSISSATYLTRSWKVAPNRIQLEILSELIFNMGFARVIQFKKFLDLFSNGDIINAAKELIDSKWHRDFVKWNDNKDTPELRSRRIEKKLLGSINEPT